MAKFSFSADATEQAGNYQPLPDDEYVLKCDECEHVMTSTKKHMLKLTLLVDEGPFIGRKVWTNIVFNPKGENGHGLTVQALKAFGFEYDGDMEIDPDEWVGKTCRAKLVKESYVKKLEDGTEQTRWKNVIPTAGFITDGTSANDPMPTQGRASNPAPAAAPRPTPAKGKVPF